MPYINDTSNPLDYLMAPLKVLGSPWGALQTGIAGGDPWEALMDPDKAIRGRQFLEKMGWADPNSGVWADAAGMGLDIADPLSMLAFSGLGKGLQALRGIPTAARAAGRVAGAGAETAGAAGMGGHALAHGLGFGLPMAGAALEGENEREGWHNPLIHGLAAGMELAPLAHGGYSLARGLMGGRGAVPEVAASTPAPTGEIRPMEDTLAKWRGEQFAQAQQAGMHPGDIATMMRNMEQQHGDLLSTQQRAAGAVAMGMPFVPQPAARGNMDVTQMHPANMAQQLAEQHGIPGGPPVLPGMEPYEGSRIMLGEGIFGSGPMPNSPVPENLGLNEMPEMMRRMEEPQRYLPSGEPLGPEHFEHQQVFDQLLQGPQIEATFGRNPEDLARKLTAGVASPINLNQQVDVAAGYAPPVRPMEGVSGSPTDPLAATEFPRTYPTGPLFGGPEGGGLQGAALTGGTGFGGKFGGGDPLMKNPLVAMLMRGLGRTNPGAMRGEIGGNPLEGLSPMQITQLAEKMKIGGTKVKTSAQALAEFVTRWMTTEGHEKPLARLRGFLPQITSKPIPETISPAALVSTPAAPAAQLNRTTPTLAAMPSGFVTEPVAGGYAASHPNAPGKILSWGKTQEEAPQGVHAGAQRLGVSLEPTVTAPVAVSSGVPDISAMPIEQLDAVAKRMGFNDWKNFKPVMSRWQKQGYEQGLTKLRGMLPQSAVSQAVPPAPEALDRATQAVAGVPKPAAKPATQTPATPVATAQGGTGEFIVEPMGTAFIARHPNAPKKILSYGKTPEEALQGAPSGAAKLGVSLETKPTAAIVANIPELAGMAPQQLDAVAKTMGFANTNTLLKTVMRWTEEGYGKGLDQLRSALPQGWAKDAAIRAIPSAPATPSDQTIKALAGVPAPARTRAGKAPAASTTTTASPVLQAAMANIEAMRKIPEMQPLIKGYSNLIQSGDEAKIQNANAIFAKLMAGRMQSVAATAPVATPITPLADSATPVPAPTSVPQRAVPSAAELSNVNFATDPDISARRTELQQMAAEFDARKARDAAREARTAGTPPKTSKPILEPLDPKIAKWISDYSAKKNLQANPQIAEQLAQLRGQGVLPGDLAEAIIRERGMPINPKLLHQGAEGRAQQAKAAEDARAMLKKSGWVAHGTPGEIPESMEIMSGIYPPEHPLYETFGYDLPIRPPIPEGMTGPTIAETLMGPKPPIGAASEMPMAERQLTNVPQSLAQAGVPKSFDSPIIRAAMIGNKIPGDAESISQLLRERKEMPVPSAAPIVGGVTTMPVNGGYAGTHPLAPGKLLSWDNNEQTAILQAAAKLAQSTGMDLKTFLGKKAPAMSGWEGEKMGPRPMNRGDIASLENDLQHERRVNPKTKFVGIPASNKGNIDKATYARELAETLQQTAQGDKLNPAAEGERPSAEETLRNLLWARNQHEPSSTAYTQLNDLAEKHYRESGLKHEYDIQHGKRPPESAARLAQSLKNMDVTEGTAGTINEVPGTTGMISTIREPAVVNRNIPQRYPGESKEAFIYRLANDFLVPQEPEPLALSPSEQQFKEFSWGQGKELRPYFPPLEATKGGEEFSVGPTAGPGGVPNLFQPKSLHLPADDYEIQQALAGLLERKGMSEAEAAQGIGGGGRGPIDPTATPSALQGVVPLPIIHGEHSEPYYRNLANELAAKDIRPRQGLPYIGNRPELPLQQPTFAESGRAAVEQSLSGPTPGIPRATYPRQLSPETIARLVEQAGYGNAHDLADFLAQQTGQTIPYGLHSLLLALLAGGGGGLGLAQGLMGQQRQGQGTYQGA